jgi:DNA-binding XRE family transcriptional regulator
MLTKNISVANVGMLERMVKHLQLLRASAGLTQEQLAAKLDISRQTISAIENQNYPLSRSLYLAMVLVFKQYRKSSVLLESFELFNSAIIRDTH